MRSRNCHVYGSARDRKSEWYLSRHGRINTTGTFRSDATRRRRSGKRIHGVLARDSKRHSYIVRSCFRAILFSIFLPHSPVHTVPPPRLLYLFCLSANVAGNSAATTSAFLPRVTYQRRHRTTEAVLLSYDDDEDGSVVSKRDIRKISGTYQDFYATQLALARYVSSVSTCERMSERAKQGNLGSITPPCCASVIR